MLAIAGGKGGCGKTTTAIGLASVLGERGRDPLVVDADTDMPNVHHLVGLDTVGGIDAVADGRSIERAIESPDSVPGVSVLTGGNRSSLADALDRLRRWPGPVLLDCPTGVNAGATRPLTAARASLLVSTDQPQCLEDARTTALVARNLAATPCGALLWRTGESPVVRAIGDYPVLETVPTVDTVSFSDPRLRKPWRTLSTAIFETDTSGGIFNRRWA